MSARRPDTLVMLFSLAGALLVVLALFVRLVNTRYDELGQAEQRLQHFSAMLAEHTARALSGMDFLLLDLAHDLSRRKQDWQRLDDTGAWRSVVERHAKMLPQLGGLMVVDETGRSHFSSASFPTPPYNVSDRAYFQALQAGAEFSVFGPYVSRRTGRYAFGMGRSINNADRSFGGVAYATLDLAYFEEFCWPIRLHNDFDAFLINERDQVIASCRPSDLSNASSVIGHPVGEVLGQPNLSLSLGVVRRKGKLLSLGKVPFPAELRVLAVLPENAALAAWSQRQTDYFFLAAAIVAILLSGGYVLRRHMRERVAIEAELTSGHHYLEERVRLATEELARQKEEAVHNNLAKSRFLAAASHDLRQPLHALSLFTTDLLRQIDGGQTDDLGRLAHQINASVSSVTEMLGTLLDISRLDMGGVEPVIHAFPVQSLFNRLHLAFRDAAANKGVGLRLRPSALNIRSDPHLLERLLANLLANAIRYTPEGGRVLVVARRHAEYVRVEVRDSGPGIAAEHQSMVFKEFFQVGNAARDQKQGLGLGLSIVQRLATTLGIALDLRSRLGRGTLLAVNLPWALDADIDDAAPESGPPTLLLFRLEIEKDRILELASDWGYDCIVASEVADLENQPCPHAMIVISTRQALGEVRALLPRHWPVAVLGEGVSDDGVAVIQTPIRPAKLRALLSQLQNTLSSLMR